MKIVERFTLEDHLCKNCGARILRKCYGGITGGGNPVFQCSTCGIAAAGMAPDVLCWCSYEHRNQNTLSPVYMCVPYSILKERPELKQAFYECGCDPDNRKSQIGIMLVSKYMEHVK